MLYDIDDDDGEEARVIISRNTRIAMGKIISDASHNIKIITPEYINAQRKLRELNPLEFVLQRQPHSFAVPEGFDLHYWHEQLGLFRFRHMVISLDGGRRMPPAEPVSAICEMFGIGSYAAVMHELHKPLRNTPDIMDYIAGELMGKWLEPVPLASDPEYRELHLLFFDIGDKQGGRLNSELNTHYPIVVDTAAAAPRWLVDTASATRESK